jgi:hypothetical protein
MENLTTDPDTDTYPVSESDDVFFIEEIDADPTVSVMTMRC